MSDYRPDNLNGSGTQEVTKKQTIQEKTIYNLHKVSKSRDQLNTGYRSCK